MRGKSVKEGLEKFGQKQKKGLENVTNKCKKCDSNVPRQLKLQFLHYAEILTCALKTYAKER